jgi:hypothetical protein
MLILQLCAALEKAKIRYAVVGGYAVALHGAVRGTVDVDVVIALTEKDFVATEAAMARLGLVSRLPVSARQVFQFRREYIRDRNLIAWSFYHPQKPSEVVDIVITHDAAAMKTKKIKVAGTNLRIAAIDELIRMKEKSGRPQDLEDIRALRALSKGRSS